MSQTGSSEPGWPLLPLLEGLDAGGLRFLLASQRELASTNLGIIPGHPRGAMPLNYVAMLRYDAPGGRWRDMPGSGPLAQALLDAGAPLEGLPDDTETPLITAASYGDAEVARVLIKAGANLEAVSAPEAGGVPDASALVHAAVFGNTGVLNLLVQAGATVPTMVIAAAAGDLSSWNLARASDIDRILALIMAADHERLDVIDQLLVIGTPIDAADPEWQRHPLRLAASNGRAGSVQHLLFRGADPQLRDDDGHTALELARSDRLTRAASEQPGYDDVERLLGQVSGHAPEHPSD